MAARRQTRSPTPRFVTARPTGDHRTAYLVEVLGVRHPVAIHGAPGERITAIANLQRGRVSREQLRAAGIADRTISRLFARGFLHRVHRGVYAVGHMAPAPLADEAAALLACGSHAALSHQTAARIWGLLDDRSIHVTIRNRHGANPKRVHAHRTNRLTHSEVEIVEQLPVTSPARTLVDFAATADLRTLQRAVEEALIQKLVSRKQLRQAASRRSTRGGRRIAAILGSQEEPGVTRSHAERRFRELMRAAQLTGFVSNARIHGVEVDFYWPELGVVVEVQSHKYHLTKAALERDTRKAARLTAAGLTVSYVTWLQMEREPFAVVARTAQLLARAGTPPGQATLFTPLGAGATG